MAYFPLFVNLEGRRVLVVGGGKIAARRIRTLLEFGCEITVVAPEVGEELREMLEPDAGTVYAEEERKSEKVTPGSCRIIWKRKKYEIKEPEEAVDEKGVLNLINLDNVDMDTFAYGNTQIFVGKVGDEKDSTKTPMGSLTQPSDNFEDFFFTINGFDIEQNGKNVAKATS